MNNQQQLQQQQQLLPYNRKIKASSSSSRKIVPLIALSLFLIAIIPVYYPFLNNIYSPKASDYSQSTHHLSISNPHHLITTPLIQVQLHEESNNNIHAAAAAADDDDDPEIILDTPPEKDDQEQEEKAVPVSVVPVPVPAALPVPVPVIPVIPVIPVVPVVSVVPVVPVVPVQSEIIETKLITIDQEPTNNIIKNNEDHVHVHVQNDVNVNNNDDHVHVHVQNDVVPKNQKQNPIKRTSPRRSRRSRGGGRKRKRAAAAKNRAYSSSLKEVARPAAEEEAVVPLRIDNNKAKEEEEEEEEVVARKKEQELKEGGRSNCDISLGEWVSNPEGPYYTNTTCSTIQEHQNCLKFGRPDTGFLKWRWKPQGCELPIFDPVEFLEIMRGKKMGFVGDSVARNHMQSLICLLSRVEEAVDVSEIPYGSQFKRYEFRKHKVIIAIFWSPYLVRTSQEEEEEEEKEKEKMMNSENRPFNLFLDEADPKWTEEIAGFDYLIISAGHWFFRPTMFYIEQRLAGCLYCPQSDITHLTSYFSYRRAFRTAFKGIVQQGNYRGTTFLRSFAPSHFENGYWDKGGDCVRVRPYGGGEEESRLDGYNMEHYKIQLEELKIAQRVGRGRGLKFRMMDVTRAMLMRPDGHPSKYGHWPTTPNVTLVSDCVHWCLPGPVDSWNDFLIELLRREEQQQQLQPLRTRRRRRRRY